MVTRAILGTGLLGSGMAEGARARGDTVHAWNRTIARAEPLRAHGVHVTPSLAEAIADAEIIHLVLAHDVAVDATLDQLRALAPSTPIVDHSTTSPAGTLARATALANDGLRYLHAPVFMSPNAARASQGTMIVAGPTSLFEAVGATLEPMCATLHHVGRRRDLAAAMKLFGNAMNLTMLYGVADVLRMAGGLGIEPEAALDVFGIIDVRYVIEGRGRKMARGDDEPLWSVDIARKDLGLMMDCAPGDSFGALQNVADALDALREAGLGERDVARLGIARADTESDDDR